MIRFFAIIVVLWAGIANAQTPAEAAIAVADRLTKAGNTLAQVQGARNRVAALTQTVRAYEDELIAMRDGLRRAAIRQSTLETAPAAQSEAVGRLLVVRC